MNETLRLQMLEKAKEAQQKAYAVYSNFHVGACLLTEDDQLFEGCNIENASYGLTMCAEATAIGHMIAVVGVKKIKAIAIITDIDGFIPSCGACRQRLMEFSDEDTLVYMYNHKGEYETETIGNLLIRSFKFKKKEQ